MTTLTPGADAGPAPTSGPLHSQPVVSEAIAGIYRVEYLGMTLGYVQETGQRFVALLGGVYNTSVEIAQTLTLDSAVRRLTTA